MASSTTLVTFLYQAPRSVSRIEIMGSWDNFSKPYPMQRDKSVSNRSWKGCHSFSDIVCDGDILIMDGSTRNGGLRMGGTYWYYYRLDDDVECHDPMAPSTRGCPFLPGQQVNILEVPIQKDATPITSLFNVFTLDPDAKYISPSRPPKNVVAPTSSIKSALRRATSMKQSFLSTIPRLSLSRTRTSPNRRCSTSVIDRQVKASHRPYSEGAVAGLRDDWLAFAESFNDEYDQPHATSPCQKVNMPDGLRSHPVDALDRTIKRLNLDDASSIFSQDTPLASLSDDGFEESSENIVNSIPYDTSRSDRTSGVFSLLSDSNIGSPFATNRHSYFHTQPQTPSLELDSFVLEPLRFDVPRMDNAIQNSLPYSHSPPQHSSSVTLRPLVTPLKDLNHTAQLSPFEKLDMVQSWRHGESPSTVPPAEPSALQELINDLGYLSSMIE